MPRNESSALAPVAKRQKNGTETQPSLLLEAQPEINRNVYSFLTLKEALILRCTHRQFSNTASQDIFQYSFIMNRKALTERGFAMEYQSYLEKQKSFICRLPDPENLRAYLRNETFENDENLHLYFMCDLVKYSTVDNGEAASILLEDGRCIIDAGVYQYMLRKDFFGMAAVLREDDWVQAGLKICPTCDNNIGYYECINNEDCVNDCEEAYCRECVMGGNRFCKGCKHHFCRDCVEQEVPFSSCEKCHGIQCNIKDCTLFIECGDCERVKCHPCISEDGEDWTGLDGGTLCPTCTAERS